MTYKNLGRTGVRVSPLCLGTMTFGREADEATCVAMYRRAREIGINFIDCANVYAAGKSEEILGRLMRGHRDELVISSKFYGAMGQDVNARGCSRRNLMLSIEASLKRLQTDRLDLYYIHNFDPAVAMEDTLRGLEDLVRQGKILYPAVSNFAAWQVAKALGLCAQRGWAPLACLQPMYSLVKRQAEVELFPLAEAEGLAVVTYSPLGGGLLTGKYRGGAQPKEGRLTVSKFYHARYDEQEYHETAERLVSFCEQRGLSVPATAIAWAAANPAVTAPIIGARNLEQLDAGLAALDVKMTPELRAEISALSRTPPVATDRRDEQVGLWVH